MMRHRLGVLVWIMCCAGTVAAQQGGPVDVGSDTLELTEAEPVTDFEAARRAKVYRDAADDGADRD